MRLARHAAIPLGAAIATLSLAACSDERTLDADEFIDATNSAGAPLALGSALESERSEVTVYEVALEDEGEPAASETAAHGHGGGTLTVLADDEAAVAEYERCEGAVSLLCFRAANVVLFFGDELPVGDRERIADALRALESE